MNEYAPSLEEFCRREHRRLVGTLTLYTSEPELAAELAQEALARVCVHWPKVSRMDMPGAWAHRVALNLANSTFNRRAAERRATARRGADETSYSEPDTEAALVLRQAVAELPPRQRSVLVLRYFADMSVAETAAAMRCAPGTVKALTSQAIARLRALDVTGADHEELEVHDAQHAL